VNKAIEALEKGHQFSATSFVLDGVTVARYVEAVEDEALPRLAQAEDKAWVPPMAVAALALRSLMEEMTLPAGSIHVSQELEFVRAMETGEQIACRAWLNHRSQRGGYWVLAVEMEGADESGRSVLAGRLTVMVPR
jgi:acyl dehydratase